MASSSAETTPQARVLDFLRLVVVVLEEGRGRLGAMSRGWEVVGGGERGKEGRRRAQLSFPSFSFRRQGRRPSALFDLSSFR